MLAEKEAVKLMGRWEGWKGGRLARRKGLLHLLGSLPPPQAQEHPERGKDREVND